MLLFSQHTGELMCILLDEGYLTDVRTAVAGAVAAKYLAPAHVERIGVVGTGTQARLQLLHLKPVTRCREILVWGRDDRRVMEYVVEMEEEGYTIESVGNADEVLDRCNLVVTTTLSTAPLLNAEALRPGTHITAVGSDTPAKQELDAGILKKADVVVADSISQCLLRGEIFQAIQAGQVIQDELVELGRIISGDSAGRTSADQITVADLTGVAVQDIKIATAVYDALREN
jgi:ornithine cyclodeaminase